MKRFFGYILLAVSLLALPGCDGSHFKVSADLEGLNNENVRVVFVGDSGLTDVWMPAREGKLRFKGASAERTLLTLLNKDGAVMAMMAVANGETLKLTGHVKSPSEWKVEGSEVNERWWQFKKENAALYAARDAKLDAAIERYAEQNPADELSAFLLLCDYGSLPQNAARVGKLVSKLAPEARPATLLQALDEVLVTTRQAKMKLSALLLYNRAKKDFVSLDLLKRVSLLYLWTNRQPDRPAHVRLLRDLWQKSGGKVHIADINTEADTTMWQSTLLADSSRWQHYWAPGGPQDMALRIVNLTSTPLYIVTDSLGNQVYRGADARQACQAAERLLPVAK